jgi:hypothetical protein
MEIEKQGTGDDAGLDVESRERCLIDLRERGTSTLACGAGGGGGVMAVGAVIAIGALYFLSLGRHGGAK